MLPCSHHEFVIRDMFYIHPFGELFGSMKRKYKWNKMKSMEVHIHMTCVLQCKQCISQKWLIIQFWNLEFQLKIIDWDLKPCHRKNMILKKFSKNSVCHILVFYRVTYISKMCNCGIKCYANHLYRHVLLK
jgi:hypothetical protein